MSKLFNDDAPGMDDATRAEGSLRAALASMTAIETSGNEEADRHIMEAEQAIRRAMRVLKLK
jgi:hypothetical protein